MELKLCDAIPLYLASLKNKLTFIAYRHHLEEFENKFGKYIAIANITRQGIERYILENSAAHFSEFDLKSGKNFYFWGRKSRFVSGFPSSIA